MNMISVESTKPKWVDNLINQLAEIHPALPAYFCTGKDSEILVPVYYTEPDKQEAVMREHNLIRLVPDAPLDYEVVKALCIILAHYHENVLMYPILNPIWAISAYKRAMTDPDFGLGEALSQASNSS